MDFVYYIVRQRDMVVLEGVEDMVQAINMAKKYNCACYILQGCVITQMGQDPAVEEEPVEEFPVDSDFVENEENMEKE